MADPDRPTRRARHPLVIIGNAIFTIILIVGLAGGLAYSVGKSRIDAPGPLGQDTIVNIPRGLGLRDIADVLARENVIDQPWFFIGGVDSPFTERRRSTMLTGGRAPPPTRSGSESFAYLPSRTFCQLSSDGVALPSTQSAPDARARTMATSRAW